MKNSFSRIGVKISNSIPDSDRALPKYKFKNTLHSRRLDILILMLACRVSTSGWRAYFN